MAECRLTNDICQSGLSEGRWQVNTNLEECMLLLYEQARWTDIVIKTKVRGGNYWIFIHTRTLVPIFYYRDKTQVQMFFYFLSNISMVLHYNQSSSVLWCCYIRMYCLYIFGYLLSVYIVWPCVYMLFVVCCLTMYKCSTR